MSSNDNRTLLDLIKLVDNVPLDFAYNCHPFYRLFFSGDPRPHGYLHPKTVSSLQWPSSFTVDHQQHSVTLFAESASLANQAFQAVIDVAVEDSASFPMMHGQHSEPFLIPGARFGNAVVRIERFTASLFGIATRGAHLTAYVRGQANDDPNDISIWVARRNKALFSCPGLLDSTVAGGVKASDTPLDCIVAESEEEARLSPDLVKSRVKQTGVVTLANKNPRTDLFHGEILHVYDLDLTDSEVPRPGDDDEVEEFLLMRWEEVVQRMLNGEFKPNVCPVMIDFFLRHGLITQETEPSYVEICTRLRRNLPMPTSQNGD